MSNEKSSPKSNKLRFIRKASDIDADIDKVFDPKVNEKTSTQLPTDNFTKLFDRIMIIYKKITNLKPFQIQEFKVQKELQVESMTELNEFHESYHSKIQSKCNLLFEDNSFFDLIQKKNHKFNEKEKSQIKELSIAEQNFRRSSLPDFKMSELDKLGDMVKLRLKEKSRRISTLIEEKKSKQERLKETIKIGIESAIANYEKEKKEKIKNIAFEQDIDYKKYKLERMRSLASKQLKNNSTKEFDENIVEKKMSLILKKPAFNKSNSFMDNIPSDRKTKQNQKSFISSVTNYHDIQNFNQTNNTFQTTSTFENDGIGNVSNKNEASKDYGNVNVILREETFEEQDAFGNNSSSSSISNIESKTENDSETSKSISIENISKKMSQSNTETSQDSNVQDVFDNKNSNKNSEPKSRFDYVQDDFSFLQDSIIAKISDSIEDKKVLGQTNLVKYLKYKEKKDQDQDTEQSYIDGMRLSRVNQKQNHLQDENRLNTIDFVDKEKDSLSILMNNKVDYNDMIAHGNKINFKQKIPWSDFNNNKQYQKKIQKAKENINTQINKKKFIEKLDSNHEFFIKEFKKPIKKDRKSRIMDINLLFNQGTVATKVIIN